MSINLNQISTEDLIKELESRGYKTTKKREKKADAVDLLNPVTMYRDKGESILREKLELLLIEELIQICKTYTPDMNRTIYRQKNKDKVINYIIERSEKLSRVGQCFKTCTEDTRIN